MTAVSNDIGAEPGSELGKGDPGKGDDSKCHGAETCEPGVFEGQNIRPLCKGHMRWERQVGARSPGAFAGLRFPPGVYSNYFRENAVKTIAVL